MNPVKRFLLIFAAVALCAWIGINVVLGPPGLSREYLDQYKHEHEHYLEIVKSDGYKHYVQRPALNQPEPGSIEEEHFAYAEAYEARPAFVEEQHRMHLYELLFEFFNATLVVVLAVRFGRKPLLNFLDNSIQELRERLDEAREAREAAKARKESAESRIAQLPEEELRIQAQTEQRLEKELADLGEANYYSLGMKERELQERKQGVMHAAELRMRRELVNTAIKELTSELMAKEEESALDRDIGRFVAELEKRT